MTKWFDVDKEGLAKLLERKGGKQFAVFELIQNAWDEKSTKVTVTLKPVRNCPQALLRVEDDNPEGFADISHAFTLFADSTKKSDPTKRGRFNLGEKLVLACCTEALISTTTGTIKFKGSERRHSRVIKRESGSVFEGYIKMTHAECEEICQSITQLIPPAHIETTFNGVVLTGRDSIAQFTAPLPTEISDAEGILRRTIRQTTISVYEPLEDEVAHIYEMGIPVVETGDRYHVDIAQKVPLNMDRDNIPPAYLRDVRAFVLNHTYHRLHEDEVKDSWVRDASADERCKPEAIQHVMVERFGEKAVAFDPTDAEANKLAVSQGYAVIHGGSMSAGEWANVKLAGVVRPAGQVTPSPKAFSPNGKPLSLMDRSKWTPKMLEVEDFIQQVGKVAGIQHINILVTNDIKWAHAGAYGEGTLYINRGRLGKGFFEDFPNNLVRVVDFLIHECGHEYCGDHLSSDYYDALTNIGAKLFAEAIVNPKRFKIGKKDLELE